MKPTYYVANEKPRSYNKRGDIRPYKTYHSNRFINKYSHSFSGLPTRDKQLQSKLVYIYSKRVKMAVPDVDNLSKPIIDSFSGVIYDDDKQIIRREVVEIERCDYLLITVNYSSIPSDIASDLNKFLADQEDHIILLEVGDAVLSDITIGGI